jgi:hypothetical protein
MPRLIAGDFPSHVYNAWLAIQIHQGRLAGLVISAQTSNIAADAMLATLLRLTNVYVAEHLVGAITLLVFFWGAFRMISAVSGRTALWLAPALAMFAYGFIFQMGLLNFCLSLGFSFFLFAQLVQQGRKDWLAILCLVVLAWMSHPLPLLWLFGTLAFYGSLQRLSPLYRALLLAFAVLTLAGIDHFLVNHFSAGWLPHGLLDLTGASQLEIFGKPYHWLAMIYLVTVGASLATLALRHNRDAGFGSAIYLFLLQAAAVFLLPYQTPVPNSPATLDLITARFSLIAAVMLLAVLNYTRPRLALRMGVSLFAVVYFVLLVRDMRTLAGMSRDLDATVQTLPAGSRVLLRNVSSPRGGLVPIHFMLERSCIAHCYAYANFEPSTRHFRVRATAPNPYVISESMAVGTLSSGQYQLHDWEQPLFIVQPCSVDGKSFCVSEYPAAE